MVQVLLVQADQVVAEVQAVATNYTTSTSSDVPAVNNSLAQKSSVKRAFEYLPENLQTSINDRFFDATIAVSYTHLTLPTKA